MSSITSNNSAALPQSEVSSGGSVSLPFSTTTSAFYHHATQSPSATAVRDLSGPVPRHFTYNEIANLASVLAQNLHDQGVRPGHRVPLIVKRGAEMVVGIWAILSCGAQYVPLDGGVVPDSTIQLVIEQCKGTAIVALTSTEHRIRKLFPGSHPILVDEFMQSDSAVHPRVDLATPERGCYVIYTSGTTGKPKGVDVTHQNVANLVCLSPGGLGIQPGMSVGQVLNISFDMAAWEIFGCMCNGGTLVIRGSKWEPTIREINVLICTPTILAKYHPADYPNIRTVATAGEPISQELADLWATHATYWNCCGPTETTIVNTMSKHVAGERISIGKPTPNNTVYILDDARRQVPLGAAGTMWAGGMGVTRGYVGLEAKTKDSYVPDVFANDGSSMYCTGDLGRWRADGSIDILGRSDDQVKIKGFRVELDSVAASLAASPGISNAVALLHNGEIHGFTTPVQDSKITIEYVRTCQPYYAVPTQIHALAAFPMTSNGKIDKKALRAMLSPILSDKPKDVKTYMQSVTSCDTLVKSRSVSSSSSSTESTEVGEEKLELPEKNWSQPWRGIRHRAFIAYRTLFTIMTLANLGPFLAIAVTQKHESWLQYLVPANLLAAILIRQDMVINVLYGTLCSLPKWFPFWIRRRCAKIYHLGGVHASAGAFATMWLVIDTVWSTISYLESPTSVFQLPILVLSWLLAFLCLTIVIFAIPTFRKKYHNSFERIHRFLGWTVLSLFWTKTILGAYGEARTAEGTWITLSRNPVFWMLCLATCAIASSWLFLRKVPVDVVPLSDHAAMLTFSYTTPVNGSFVRLSNRPLLEWHSFATIPNSDKLTDSKGFSLIVSNAGDWTRQVIQRPQTKIWVRGLPTCGVMRIATLFNRVLIIATGSGIGPVLGHINHPSCPTQLLWSTPNPEKTFGSGVVKKIKQSIPDAVIHDTKIKGRPDLVRMGYNMATSFGAEAVIIIANEKITKKVVYGLETRGLAAYGAIWDS